MACSNVGCLCKHLVISENVTFTEPNLIINIPSGSYENGEKYCIVVGQEIPTDTTIAANVMITIGDDATTMYPLVNSNCTNVSACQIGTRVRYATRVYTNIQAGVFKLLDNLSCDCGRCRSAGPQALPLPTTNVTNTTGGEG